jgi:hypothetical protein
VHTIVTVCPLNMKINKVRFPAATKVAIGVLVFLTTPVLLIGIFDPIQVLAYLAATLIGLVAALLIYLLVLRVSITVARRLSFRADLWFARKRATTGALGAQFCLLLRSTRADIALSIDGGEGSGIRDASALRLDIAPSFRSLLAHRMSPLYTLLVKNSEQVLDVVSVTYDEESWRAQVAVDMAAATLILVIPHWPSPALTWELKKLQQDGHLWKTYILMPPSYLFRPGTHIQPALVERLVDRFRYMTRETLEAVAPDYFVDTWHRVSLEAERLQHARAGWEEAKHLAQLIGLQLPEYRQEGCFLLAASLLPPPKDGSALELDAHRIIVSAGTLDWRSDTTSRLLLSVAGSR